MQSYIIFQLYKIQLISRNLTPLLCLFLTWCMQAVQRGHLCYKQKFQSMNLSSQKAKSLSGVVARQWIYDYKQSKKSKDKIGINMDCSLGFIMRFRCLSFTLRKIYSRNFVHWFDLGFERSILTKRDRRPTNFSEISEILILRNEGFCPSVILSFFLYIF